jgi:pilus assembly protein Flp/PilA
MIQFCRRLLRSERGATAIEYGLILALMTLALLGGLSRLGDSTGGLWGTNRDRVVAATGG